MMRVPLLLLALLAFLWWTPPAAAGEPRGPEFGTNRFSSWIQAVKGVPDTDQYVGRLVAGETLSVSVTSGRRSLLKPRISLVAPDGTELTPPLRLGRGGRAAALS